MSKVPWALPVKPGEYMITIVLAFILLWPREIDQYLFSVSHGLQHWFPATYRTLRPSQIHFRHPVVYQIRTVIVLICLAICFLAFQKPLKGPNPTYRKKKKLCGWSVKFLLFPLHCQWILLFFLTLYIKYFTY